MNDENLIEFLRMSILIYNFCYSFIQFLIWIMNEEKIKFFIIYLTYKKLFKKFNFIYDKGLKFLLYLETWVLVIWTLYQQLKKRTWKLFTFHTKKNRIWVICEVNFFDWNLKFTIQVENWELFHLMSGKIIYEWINQIENWIQVLLYRH